jgi:hypothetical protein
MGFVDRKGLEDEELPGSGLHLDLEVRRCPRCRQETPPWEERCPTCGVGTVPAGQLPPQTGGLPDLSHLLDDDTGDGPGDNDAGDDSGGDDHPTDGADRSG